MILGTYANLYAMEESTNTKLAVTNKPFVQINNLPLDIIKEDLHIIPDIPNSLELIPRAKGTKLLKFIFCYIDTCYFLNFMLYITFQTKLINYLT